ncbi:MAG: stalk domain-containing protein [Peptostreptococcaceae bacterium]|nr:stalk domain-containing protein [Peptostreptococcaceae bacterium]
MKKSLTLIFVFLFVVTAFAHADRTITVKIDGKAVDLKDAPAFIDERGSTLVPIRSIADNFGAQTSWDAKTQTATIKKDEKDIEISILDKKVRIGGKAASAQSFGTVKNGRTYVPLRLIAEGFEASVSYDDKTGTVSILTSPNAPAKKQPEIKKETDPFLILGITETPLKYRELKLQDASAEDLKIAKDTYGKFWTDNMKVYSAKDHEIPNLNLTLDFATTEQVGLLNNYTMSIDSIVLSNGKIVPSSLSLPNMALFGMDLNYDPKDAIDLIGQQIDKIVLDLPFDHELKQFPVIVVDVKPLLIRKQDSLLQKYRNN